MKRNYSLDFLKLVFAYIIAFFHFGITISPGAEVAVQIFFIISGFFLARKFYSLREQEYSAWDYTLHHVKQLLPHYLFSHLILFLYLLARMMLYFFKAPSLDGFVEIIRFFYNQIPDLVFLQSSFTFHDSINYPLWQISALLISGYFVFALLRQNEPLSRRIIFPMAILMVQSLLASGVDLWENFGLLYLPLLRAFGPMCIGVLTYYFTTTAQFAQVQKHRVLLNLCSVLGLAGIFLFGNQGSIFLITTPVILMACWTEKSWINVLLNHKCMRSFGKLSYAVYLNHALIERFTKARLFPHVQGYGIRECLTYFLLLTVYSIFTMVLVEKLTKWIQTRRILRKSSKLPGSDT